MRDMFFSAPLSDGRMICVSTITRDTFEANNAYDLGDDCGYFVYEYDADHPTSGIEILAKAASYDTAMRLIDLYVLALESQKIAKHDSQQRKVSVRTGRRQLREIAQ